MTLLPGTEGDPIQCSLAVVNPISGIRLFDEQLKPPDTIYYEALSYVWGDGSKTEQIICDGKLLRITESLAVALRALRQLETSRVLWADGTCINQQDMEERAGQVLLMSSIFSLAAQVICWLGHDDDGHAESF
ncbi:HET-domain-containing protein, partial [Pyrenochaeta sp. DS3sAY3a]